MTRYDAVLLIAFGGPVRMEDVRPFLANVLRGRSVAPDRIEAVVHHYERFDGHSPLTVLTFRQAEALQADLASRGPRIPVYVGMRNWTPYLHETLARMRTDGARRALGIVMAPHRSYSSYEQYQENIEEARARIGKGAPSVDYLGPWFDHPGFIQAQADRIVTTMATVPAEHRERTSLIFTAHSIPSAMASKAPYADQLATSARLAAARLRHARWSIAYQSRSGDPRTPWLDPDINDVLRGLGTDGEPAVVVVPIGFVCDHIEVLYDLDTEARETARHAGVSFHRAGTVMDHPAFIQMLGDLVRTRMAA